MTTLGTEQRPLKVAVVGSGPSGFYAAEALANSELSVQVNIVEKLPVPFGLVRHGVAPDHPKLKQVAMIYHQVAQKSNVSYYGNVEIGKDISLQDLEACHDAVIFCSGADTDRRLGIPGEDLPGSYTATEFVAWYNGHPAYKDLQFDLSAEEAVVIGQGNVAADVCRILLKSVDELRNSDIAEHAIEQLAASKVRKVHVVGRRGPAQAKFTNRELKELEALDNCSSRIEERGFVLGPEDEIELADKANYNAAGCVETFERMGQTLSVDADKEIEFHFLLSPAEILGAERVEAMTFTRNELTGTAFKQSAKTTEQTLEIPCGLCFRSIGYRGQPIPGVPFDSKVSTQPAAL